MCDLEICWMTLKNNRAPLLCYFKLCASFHSHQSIQTGDIVWKCLIRVKISNFFVLCDLKIPQMTLKNNRAPLLCYFKLCASFHSHQSIQTRVTVWKLPIQVKISDFLSCVTLKFDRWPWKTIYLSTMPHQALCIISLPYVNSNWSYGLESAKLAFDLCYLDLWLLTLIFCMDIISRNGNNSWKFEWWEHSGKGMTDGRTDRRTELFIELIGRSWNVWILSKITLKYFPKGPINNIPALV